MAAALTNEDFFEKVMVAIMNMEDIKYPNRGKPLLKWFCFKSESDMKKETLMDLVQELRRRLRHFFLNAMKDSPLALSDQLVLLEGNTKKAVETCLGNIYSFTNSGHEQYQWLTLFAACGLDHAKVSYMQKRTPSQLFGCVMDESVIKNNIKIVEVNRVRKHLQSMAGSPGILVATMLLNMDLWTPSQVQKLANPKKVNKLSEELLVYMNVKLNISDTIEKAREKMSKIVRTLNDVFQTFPNFGHEVIVTTIIKQFPINRVHYQYALYQQLKTIDEVFTSIRPTKHHSQKLINDMLSMSEGRCSADLAQCFVKYTGSIFRQRAEAIAGSSGFNFCKTACMLGSSIFIMRSEILKNMQESFNHIFGFPKYNELLDGCYKKKPASNHAPNVEALQMLSQEERRLLSCKYAEIVNCKCLESSAETLFFYFLLLNSKVDAKNNITFNYDILSMMFNLSNDGNKTEFQVLGKYTKTMKHLIEMYKVGHRIMNLFMLDDCFSHVLQWQLQIEFIWYSTQCAITDLVERITQFGGESAKC